MANPQTGATAADQRAQPTGGTALHGNIEAIGIHDLLRIAVAKGNTGRLLVFNDQVDAELYYVEGRLVAAVSSSGAVGIPLLRQVCTMTEGEFEFARGQEAQEAQHDSAIHDAMMQAIKEHYQQRVRGRQESSSQISHGPMTSGIHKVAPPQSTHSVSPTPEAAQHASAPLPETTVPSVEVPAPTEPQLLMGETGRATADLSGRTTAKIGTIATQEAALAALVSKQAGTIASLLGLRGLERFEIRGENEINLLCRAMKDKIYVSRTVPDADVEAIWSQLGT